MNSGKPPERRPRKQPPRRRDNDAPDGEEDGPRPSSSGPMLLMLVLLVIVVLYFYKANPGNTGQRVDYSFFRTQLAAPAAKDAPGNDQANISEVYFHGQVLTGKWKTPPANPEKPEEKLPDQFNTTLPPMEDPTLLPDLQKQGVKVGSEKTSMGVGAQLLVWLIGPLLIIGFLWWMMRRSADPMGGGGVLGNFARSPARRFRPSDQQTTFNDVAAMEQPKKELQEIVEFLKNPGKFHKLGAQIPKGVLLMGPPGNGKTLLARATAGEAGVPFYAINGSEFIQMFVGVGASRVRDLFRTAKDNAPAILFIDEIDAVGRVRGAGVGGGHDEREQTLNQILSEMDGFQQTEAVIVIAATNRPDVLDPALLRPGRFDRHITVDRPSRQGREEILKVHARKVPLAEDVKLSDIAAGTVGFSGADLKNLVNEAALIASRVDKTKVTREDFEMARDRVLMGPLREEVLGEEEKQMTAYHEAGHALLAWLLPELDPVHKVTVVPRGRALGVTQLLPDEERYNVGEKRLHSQLAMMLAGRAAEKLVFDEYSAGAEDDIKRATQMARRMVAHWGMSEIIGPVAFRQGEEHPFLGKEMHEHREFSEETARIIDQQVQKILTDAARRATEILEENRETLDLLADRLVEQEALDRDELTRILGARVPRNSARPRRAPVQPAVEQNGQD